MDGITIEMAATVARLSALPALSYDRVRKPEAEALGVLVQTLDEAVRRARRSISSSLAGENFRAPEFSDEALALRFADRHADSMRYVDSWGRWFIYDGRVWEPDNTRLAFDRSRAECREIAKAANDPTVAISVASSSTVAAVEKLAKADRRHAATVNQWDANPWILNTPDGTVDLKTGELMSHRPEDYCTKITAVSPKGDCDLWRAFLKQVTNEDQELQNFIQRMAGYALTGITSEHALFFAYGTGGNGKGVFLNTMTAILASYAAVASMETFTATPNAQHPTDLAMLRGSRLVTAQETEEGRRWAEARIKAMTGGDPITARFMRQDFFTFTPQFKLIIAGNHKPGLRNVDEAMRRRFNLVPFTKTIPAADRDRHLQDKLKAEWAGILQWAIDGCMLWQEKGLAPPAAVIDATAEYLESEDALAGWLAERCKLDNTLTAGSSALFSSWKDYAETAGEFVGTQRRFSQAMQSRGFAPTRLSDGKAAFKCIGLNAPAPNQRRGPHDD